MNKKVLIFKSNDNGFERFCSSKFESEGYDVADPYRIPFSSMTKLQKRLFFGRFRWFSRLYMGDWKKTIRDYETVIIFDSALTKQLVRFVRSANRKCDIRIWLWNTDPIDKEFYGGYCSIYTFDRLFAEKHGYNYIPQFYFDGVSGSRADVTPGVFFAGYDKGRYDELKKIASLFDEHHITHRLIMKKEEGVSYLADDKVVLIEKDIDYTDLLHQMTSYSCLLELNINGQSGLTLRALEALFNSRKLITNNKDITKYDFYNPGNIFLLGIDDESRLEDFVRSPFEPVDADVISGYSFRNWISKITGEQHG